ncbi:MAG: lipoate--protein ligase [Lentimicrobiaceae bacterium]|nr:lipoate--protein ligase [Lentimicrobiaceae bacterium]
MLFVDRPETDPYFNLAAEEYIFRNIRDDVIMLWRNTPAVIIGKHQNPHREVNLTFARENHLPVIRRITGGGTVYQDMGDINFTFIRSEQTNPMINYGAILHPLISIMNSWHIPCKMTGKSDITIHDRKISGNAQHIFKNRILHHGTLLYASNLEDLNSALTPTSRGYHDRSIRSNPYPVANISDFLSNPPSIEQFQEQLHTELLKIFSPIARIGFTSCDRDSIRELAEKKYKTWEWNFGYSPPYQLQTQLPFQGRKVKIEILVKNGIMQKIHIFDSLQDPGYMAALMQLEGLKHEEHAIRLFFNDHPRLAADMGLTVQEICKALF